MREKLIVKTVSLLAIAIFLSACSSNELETVTTIREEIEIHADFFTIADVDEMADIATNIVRGEILDKRVEWVNLVVPRELVEADMLEQGMTQEEIDFELYGFDFEEDPHLMTIYQIQVLEAFQGDHVIGEIIEIMRQGGVYEDEYWFVADAIELTIGDEYVLFLYTSGLTDSPYVLVSHVQGVYSVPSEIEIEESLVELEDLEMEIELDNASELDPIMITIEDLIEIAEDNDLLND